MIEKLIALLATLSAQMTGLIEACGESGQLSAEDTLIFDDLKAQYGVAESNLERAKSAQAIKDKMEAGTGRKSDPGKPGVGAGVSVTDNRNDDPMRGFESVTEFAGAVKAACGRGGVDERLKIKGAPSNYHKEVGSSDGYMVPPQVRSEIMSLVFDDGDLSIVNQVETEPTDSNSVELLRDESTPWGSTGVQSYWGNEADQLTASRLDTEGSTVKLHKLHAFVLSTEELLSDAARLQNRLTKGAAQAIQWKASDAIFYGTGSGQPLGFHGHASQISVAKETSQVADTIVAANVAKMYSRMIPSSIPRAVWYVNSDALPQLLTMTLGDNGIYALPQNGFTQAPGGFLLGRPVIFTEHNKTVGDKGDIVFADPKGYYAPIKNGGVKFAQSMHLFFDYDVEAFRWTFRMGGQPFLSGPVSSANGSNTKSHFVTLAARA